MFVCRVGRQKTKAFHWTGSLEETPSEHEDSCRYIKANRLNHEMLCQLQLIWFYEIYALKMEFKLNLKVRQSLTLLIYPMYSDIWMTLRAVRVHQSDVLQADAVSESTTACQIHPVVFTAQGFLGYFRRLLTVTALWHHCWVHTSDQTQPHCDAEGWQDGKKNAL